MTRGHSNSNPTLLGKHQQGVFTGTHENDATTTLLKNTNLPYVHQVERTGSGAIRENTCQKHGFSQNLMLIFGCISGNQIWKQLKLSNHKKSVNSAHLHSFGIRLGISFVFFQQGGANNKNTNKIRSPISKPETDIYTSFFWRGG